MSFPKHVHVKRRKQNAAGALAQRIQDKVKRHLLAVLSAGAAIRDRVG